MTGAAIIASRAALKSGAGLVTLGTPESLGLLMNKVLIEATKLFLPQTAEISLDLAAYEKIVAYMKERKISAMAIGPGISLADKTQKLVRKLIPVIDAPLVLDATA